MTLVTKLSTAKFDAMSTKDAGYLAGQTAGSAIAKLDACFLYTDGKVYPAESTYKDSFNVGAASTGSYVQNISKFAGFAPEAYASGAKNVTLFRAYAVAGYASSENPGTLLFICASGSAGKLQTTPSISGDLPVAMVLENGKDIQVIR